MKSKDRESGFTKFNGPQPIVQSVGLGPKIKEKKIKEISGKTVKVSIDMGKGKGKGFSRIAKLVTASAREQQQVIVIVKYSLCRLRIK